jgi:hypothetical protein
MNVHKLFAPADDLAGGAGGGDAGAAGAPAGGDAPSMDDTIRNTYRDLMSAGGNGEGGEADAGAGDEGERQQKPAAGQQRGTDGRFAKGGAQAAGAEGSVAGDPATGEQQQTKPHDAMPNTWRKEMAETWKALPETARQEIHKREQDFHNGVKQYKDAAGFGASMAQEMLPYQEIMRQQGVSPQSVVRDIMASLKTMVTGSEESKAAEFLKLASTYGINLDTVLSLRQRAPAQAAPELQPVLQRVQQIETRITQADQEREQAQQREDDARVQAFLNDPKNEHARTVSKQMSALLMSGQAQDMQDAYEQAIWIHPEVRPKLLEKQEAERRKKESEEAAAARKAAAANVTRRGTPPTPAKPGSMDDTIRSTYRKLTGG